MEPAAVRPKKTVSIAANIVAKLNARELWKSAAGANTPLAANSPLLPRYGVLTFRRKRLLGNCARAGDSPIGESALKPSRAASLILPAECDS